MAYNDFVQSIANAIKDALTLDDVVNGEPNKQAQSRLGRLIYTLATINHRVDIATIQANQKLTELQAAINTAAAAGAGANGWTDALIRLSNGRTQADKNTDTITLADFGITNNYIDDAIDAFKAYSLSSGAMTGKKLKLPSGILHISRSHDLSATGVYLQGEGGRYATRIVADADGDYGKGYVIKLAPTEGSVVNNGSGLTNITIDLNEAPSLGLLYQGAYDVSVVDAAEVINAHKDYPAAIIEPHPNGTVIQTLKIDTSSFSKKQTGGTGYTVVVRKAQECLIINSKFFGAPSNKTDKGSIPLLLEDVRGVQIIGGGFANSESHCIDIYAKTRNTTHVTIIGPTFEGYKSKAIRTRAETGFTVSRLVCMNERLISPAAGLLEGGSLTFSILYACNADIELLAGSTNNIIHAFDKSKVIDNGQYNEVIESPSTLNSNRHVSTRQQSVKMTSTPAYNLEVEGKTGGYRFQWTASATTDAGAAIYTPNGSQPMRFLDDRIGFYGTSPVTQRTSPLSTSTDAEKISAIILGLEQLGLFKKTV